MSNYKVTNWTEPPDCLQCDGLWDAQSGSFPGSPVHQPQNGYYSTCFYLIFAVFALTVLVLCKDKKDQVDMSKNNSDRSSSLVYSEILVHCTLYSSQDHVLPNMLTFK